MKLFNLDLNIYLMNLEIASILLWDIVEPVGLIVIAVLLYKILKKLEEIKAF